VGLRVQRHERALELRHADDHRQPHGDQLGDLERVMCVHTPVGIARRLLRVHTLRAADALQLAAAITVAEGLPASLEVVTLDQQLAAAARREGFPVLEKGHRTA
jgi:predicted nucleic acid-binding protein